MKKTEFEARVMKYFAENMNLQKNWEIANDFAKEICGMRFGELVTGEFEIPPVPEIKEKITERVAYHFDRTEFIQNGPIDFSEEDEERVHQTLERIEALYQQHVEAQAIAISKTVRQMCDRIIKNIRKEIDEVRKRHFF